MKGEAYQETEELVSGILGSVIDSIEGNDIYLNGELLEAAADGSVGELAASMIADGRFELLATSIAFVIDAGAAACAPTANRRRRACGLQAHVGLPATE